MFLKRLLQPDTCKRIFPYLEPYLPSRGKKKLNFFNKPCFVNIYRNYLIFGEVNKRKFEKMRGVGIPQNEQDHFVLNPRKLAQNYLKLILLRYRVLSPAPLTKLGNPRTSLNLSWKVGFLK